MLPLWILVLTSAIAAIASYAMDYFGKYSSLRDIPSPSPWAALSRLWLLAQSRRGCRYLSVNEAHERLGTFVRLQPNHISIASIDAIRVIYGHGGGFLKADFYDAFVSVSPGLFSTRSRAEHTRKRKIVSHTFSAKSVAQFEQYVHSSLGEFTHQWDSICSKEPNQEYAHIDCLPWFNYLAFDTMGDLAFGKSFGMLKSGEGRVKIMDQPGSEPRYTSAIDAFNRRGAAFAALGCLPALKPYARWFPDQFFRVGISSGKEVAGIGILRVDERLRASKEEKGKRVDILARLMEGKDSNGQPLGRDELTGEALTQLVAGSDTTSNSLCPILFWILKTPGVLEKLRSELDAVIPSPAAHIEFQAVKDLPYLNAVINETLRIHTTNCLGLPRVVPLNGNGAEICGRHFPPGTVISVPTYTMHHLRSIWGDDVEDFVPERWYAVTDEQKQAYIPFGIGPRSCSGRNVAEMELCLIIATVIRRYDLELYEDELVTSEGFLRKPLRCNIGIKKRAE